MKIKNLKTNYVKPNENKNYKLISKILPLVPKVKK